MARRVVFLDTSFVVALENTHDPHHACAKSLDDELLRENVVLLLHLGIVLEIGDGYARFGRRARGIDLLTRFESEDGYVVFPLNEPLMEKAQALYRARTDKEWGLTDCISFVLMKQEGVTEALTADVHFRQAGFTALLLDSP